MFIEEKCPQCGKSIIFYTKEMTCTNCHTPFSIQNHPHLTFIPYVHNAIATHKKLYRSAIPPAWFLDTTTERVAHIIFRFYDFYEGRPRANFEKDLAIFLDFLPWKERAHEKILTRQIIRLMAGYSYKKAKEEPLLRSPFFWLPGFAM